MKRERKPPKTWRRNMLAGAALLALLDASILSASPNLERGVLALVVTVLVGGFIVAVWRSNSRMEREREREGVSTNPREGGSKKKGSPPRGKA